jgi:DMSO/TMAO reductase YedYZ molybdopterin-dependent catalytic subunit
LTAEDYALTITGLVSRETTYTLEQLKEKEQRDSILAMQCVANPPGGAFVANLKWSGVPLNVLLKEVGVKPEAKAVHVIGYDNWDFNLSLDRAKNPNTLLAMKLNDKELTNDTGYPVRFVPVGANGNQFVMWVKTIEVVQDEHSPMSLIEEPSFPEHAIAPNSGFLKPDKGVRVKAGSSVVMEGWAFGGGNPTARIAKLHFSGDYGKTWRVFSISAGDSSKLVYWKFKWETPGVGTYLLKVKAEDENGKLQPTKASIPGMPDLVFPDSMVIIVE